MLKAKLQFCQMLNCIFKNHFLKSHILKSLFKITLFEIVNLNKLFILAMTNRAREREREREGGGGNVKGNLFSDTTTLFLAMFKNFQK